MSRLAAASGTLRKLSFSVVREVNATEWAAEGERLLDRRLGGKLKGRGTLLDYTNQMLVPSWKTGDANTVRDAMTAFQNELLDELLNHAPIAKSDQAEYRNWAQRFAKWPLRSTGWPPTSAVPPAGNLMQRSARESDPGKP